jgi:hypothetical protein
MMPTTNQSRAAAVERMIAKTKRALGLLRTSAAYHRSNPKTLRREKELCEEMGILCVLADRYEVQS